MEEARELAKREEKEEARRIREEKKVTKKEARKSADMTGSRASNEYRNFFFGRRSGKAVSRLNISSPFAADEGETQSRASDGAPHAPGSKGDDESVRTYLNNAASNSSKKALVAPKRPARPSFEESLSLSSNPEPSPTRWTSPPVSPPAYNPPTVPFRSPLQTLSGVGPEDSLVPEIARLDLREHKLESGERSRTAPAASGRTSSNSLLQAATATLRASKRATIGDGIEGRGLFTSKAGRVDKRPVTSSDGSRKRSELSIRSMWEQAHNNEMAKMTDGNQTPQGEAQKGPDLALTTVSDQVVEQELPGTPSSILKTPVEMYARPRPGGHRESRVVDPRGRQRSNGSQRTALSPLSDTNAKQSDSLPVDGEELPSSRWLTPVPKIEAFSENTPPRSGTATPVATKIHLRGGSIVTVVPPELTAWQRAAYIQGPIRLLKPTVWPRKDSVASLEPFQTAIDQVYMKGLATSTRRRSDDGVVDDVCDWFADFGFDEIAFAGDVLTFDPTVMEDLREEIDDPSPVERTVAKEVIMSSDVSSLRSKRSSYVSMHSVSSSRKQSIVLSDGTRLPIARAQTAEDLRVRGIARLSRYRKQSVMSTASSGVLPITPLGEESMFQLADDSAVAEDDRTAFGTGGNTGAESAANAHQSDEVDEMECGLACTAPGAFSRNVF